MAKENDVERVSVIDKDAETTEQQIANFAAKLGEQTGGKFQVYIYRLEKDEESGKLKKPFVKKYIGIEPDPSEIAERFRGGSYLCQFIWYVKGEQKSKGWTIDVDEDAFPPLPKDKSLIPYQVNPNLSETMQLQLATITAITEVMKAGYAAGNNGSGRNVEVRDPLEQFSGLMETMEASYGRAMQIQSKVMERVYTRSLENRFGLSPDGAGDPGAAAEEPGMIGQYGGMIKEIIGGLKYVVGLFGEVPSKVVEKVKKDERFRELLKDPKALTVIGSALRREFGDSQAAAYMEKFGVRMVKRPQIARTPEIPGLRPAGQGRESPRQAAPAAPAAQAAAGASPVRTAPKASKKAQGGESGKE